MENVRNRVNVKLVTNKKDLNKLAKKPNYKRVSEFHENLAAVHMEKTTVKLYKPIYLGMSILDLSKTLMYEFHYDYVKPKWGDKSKLLFTDTDSLCYEIQTNNVYEDIKNDVDRWYDTTTTIRIIRADYTQVRTKGDRIFQRRMRRKIHHRVRRTQSQILLLRDVGRKSGEKM